MDLSQKARSRAGCDLLLCADVMGGRCGVGRRRGPSTLDATEGQRQVRAGPMRTKVVTYRNTLVTSTTTLSRHFERATMAPVHAAGPNQGRRGANL